MIERKWRWWERFGLVSLFLTVLSLVILIAINFRPLYVFDIHYLNILDYTILDQKTLLANFDQLMRFLNNPFAHHLALPDFPMSAGGRSHFYDVKKLFLLDYVVFFVTLIPSIVYVRHLWKNKRFWKVIRPFQIGMLVPVIFGFLMMLGFDRFFILFHETFFNNSDWLFDPRTDPIINVLPETFFMHSFILCFVLIEVFFLIFVLIGKRELKK